MSNSFTIRPYKVHNKDFLLALAKRVLAGTAMVNWQMNSDDEEVSFIAVKQATPKEMMKLRSQCNGLFFFAIHDWALPHMVHGKPIFHTVEPMSREEVEAFISIYKDEKARRIANSGGA